jgi:hypothetical protein
LNGLRLNSKNNSTIALLPRIPQGVQYGGNRESAPLEEGHDAPFFLVTGSCVRKTTETALNDRSNLPGLVMLFLDSFE